MRCILSKTLMSHLPNNVHTFPPFPAWNLWIQSPGVARFEVTLNFGMRAIGFYVGAACPKESQLSLLFALAGTLWIGWGLPSCVCFCFGQDKKRLRDDPLQSNKTHNDFIPSLQTLHLVPKVTVPMFGICNKETAIWISKNCLAPFTFGYCKICCR